MDEIGKYWKAIVAAFGQLVLWAATAWVPDGEVSREEAYALVVAIATTWGVYKVTNKPT